MRFDAGVATDIGRVREGNEDSFLSEHPLYAVADGMGGHRGGEVASQLALDTLGTLFREGRGTLAEQVREANRVVFERSAGDRKVAGMGTTLTAALIEGDSAHLVHVGDSRAYLLRAGSLRQVTQDHTLVARMVKLGEITPGEAEVHPHRNVLTRVLGTEPDMEPDEEDLGLLEGDRLLLCSDGLTSMVTEDQIQAIMETTPRAQEVAEKLVRTANRAGGLDNITVLVLDALPDEGGGSGPLRSTDVAPRTIRRDEPTWDRRRLVRWGVSVAVFLVALVAGFAAMRTWLDGRWYVGVANGHVAVYQGIPAEVLGFELSHVDVETDISADEAMALPLYSGLADGINATSREDALGIVDQIEEDLRKQDRLGQETVP